MSTGVIFRCRDCFTRLEFTSGPLKQRGGGTCAIRTRSRDTEESVHCEEFSYVLVKAWMVACSSDGENIATICMTSIGSSNGDIVIRAGPNRVWHFRGICPSCRLTNYVLKVVANTMRQEECSCSREISGESKEAAPEK